MVAAAVVRRTDKMQCSQQIASRLEHMAFPAPIDRSAGVAGLMMAQNLAASKRRRWLRRQLHFRKAQTVEQANSSCPTCLLDGTPDTLGRRGQVDMLHPELTQAVDYGIGNHRQCRRNATFSAAPKTKRMGR